MSRPITERSVLRVLLFGFSLVIVLLVAAGYVGVRNVRLIQESAAHLVSEQTVTSSLIDEIHREQGTLNAVFYNMGRGPDWVDREHVMGQLDASDEAIERIISSAEGTPDEQLWKDLRKEAVEFSAEARRLLAQENASTFSSRALLRQHEEVISIIAKLIANGLKRSEVSQEQIEALSRRLVNQSSILLGASLLLALLFALYTVRLATNLFRKMEEQTGELSRVSWHMLENQETTARRFSHELHDELGQSLTALKANLVALAASPERGRERLEDCLSLVDASITNVRELSQLLRPTILDDFGLDASLRWLAERFTQRTRIEVNYESNLTARLPEETETHLFRIAQEALTNVARHSGASEVRVELDAKYDRVYLRIGDNGRGLNGAADPARLGMGMIGMRARARSAGGEMVIARNNGNGLLLTTWVPVRAREHEVKDPHPVGR